MTSHCSVLNYATCTSNMLSPGRRQRVLSGERQSRSLSAHFYSADNGVVPIRLSKESPNRAPASGTFDLSGFLINIGGRRLEADRRATRRVP